MSEVLPSPWGCTKCRKVARTYASGAVFCEACKKTLKDHEKVDISRGVQKNTPTPSWKPVKDV